MSKIRGTTIELQKFLFDVESEIKVIIDNQPKPIFKFNIGRTMKIPDYQREIRWSKEVLLQLINDLKHKEKFLGNIIITPIGNDCYEIIDGQQRITVLMMILNYINESYKKDISDMQNLVRLELNCFSEFSMFQKNNYSCEMFSKEDLIKIEESDKFNQRGRLSDLYDEIKRNGAFSNVDGTRKFVENLLNSSINVVISEDNDLSRSTQYYIDVNLKGVRLDNEDIFKGYVFAQNKSPSIRKLWIELKSSWCRFNRATKTEDVKSSYPFMDIIEHFIICVLLSEKEYNEIDIDSSLALTKPCSVKNTEYCKGEHVVNAINSSGRMEECLSKARDFIEFITETAETDGIGKIAKEFYEQSNGNTKEIVHNLFKKILMDKKLIVPKALLVKYYLEVLLKKGGSEELKTFYAVYMFRAIFFLFIDDKSLGKFNQILRSKGWIDQIVLDSNRLLKDNDLSSRKLMAMYRSISNLEDIDLKYRCKSLATVYNFFMITDRKISLRNDVTPEMLVQFLENDEEFTIEHLVINESQTIQLTNGELYILPKDIKGNSKHIFNFVIIPRLLNGEKSQNKALQEKLEIIDDEIVKGKIKCNFTIMAIEIAKNSFQKFPKVQDKDPISSKELLANYFDGQYRKDYHNYVQDLINKLIIRLTTSAAIHKE